MYNIYISFPLNGIITAISIKETLYFIDRTKFYLCGVCIQAEGYMISCLSVNDPYVMAAWGKSTKAEGKVRIRLPAN